MRCGPAASLDQLQALFALRMLLDNLTGEDATAPPLAVSLPTGGACVPAGGSLRSVWTWPARMAPDAFFQAALCVLRSYGRMTAGGRLRIQSNPF